MTTPADYIRRNKHGVFEYYRRVPTAIAPAFGLPTYGDGAELARRRDFLEGIRLV